MLVLVLLVLLMLLLALLLVVVMVLCLEFALVGMLADRVASLVQHVIDPHDLSRCWGFHSEMWRCGKKT